MARKNNADADTTEMFPELDTSKPEEKALYAAAKKYVKAKGEREALLSTSKEKVDAAMEKVISGMHECKIKKFIHNGVRAEIILSREKVEVTIEDESQDDGDDD